MKRFTQTILLAGILALGTLHAEAPKLKPSDPKMVAAYKLLETMHMADSYKRMTKQITDMQVAQAPQVLIPVRDTIEKFFEKYMGWDAIKEDIARLYATHYSKEELAQMQQFFASKTGQKYISLTPTLAAESAKIGQSKLAGHMQELKKMLDEKLKTLNPHTGKPKQNATKK